MRLYEYNKEYTDLFISFELDEIEEDDLIKKLDELDSSFKSKALNTAKYINNLEADEKALQDEIRRLQDRKKAITNKKNRLKDYLLENMLKTDITKVDDALITVSIRNNAPKLKIENEDQIPDNYIKVEEVKKIDRRSLLKDIKEGLVIEGITLEDNPSVTIK